MDKTELARILGRQAGVEPARAADELDRVIFRILTKLRRGEPARLPGLGRFLPDAQKGIRFEQSFEKNRGRRGGGRG